MMVRLRPWPAGLDRFQEPVESFFNFWLAVFTHEGKLNENPSTEACTFSLFTFRFLDAMYRTVIL